MTEAGTQQRRYIWVSRDTWAPLDVVARDPQQRAAALEAAKRFRAPRKYRALVEAFAEFDAATGASPLIARKLEDGPEPRCRGWTDKQQLAAALRYARRSVRTTPDNVVPLPGQR